MEKTFIDVIIRLDEHFKKLNIKYMIVGAKARDIIGFKSNIPPSKRKTNDVDFGVMVESWKDLDRVKKHLFTDKDIEEFSDFQTKVRFNFKGTLFDVVPFGKIEVNGQVIWPPDASPVMTVVGYKEAYENALDFDVEGVMVKVVSPEMLVALKFVSWNENPARDRDAFDMAYIISQYGKIDQDAENTVFEHYPEFNETTDFDLEHSIMILLGRRIRTIISPEHKEILNFVLTNRRTELARAMVEENHPDRDGRSSVFLKYLEMINHGLE